jgi:hypothetical protein
MKTYQEFFSEAKKCWPGYKKKGTQKLFGKTYNRCVKEGKVEWDNPKRPLQSGLTPREKNRAVRKRLGIETPDTDKPSFFKDGPGEKEYERYGKLKAAHDAEKDKDVPEDERHKFKSVAKGRLGGEHSAGRIRRMAGVHKGAEIAKNAEKGKGRYAVMSQVQGAEKVREKHKKRYGDYADLKRLQEPKESFEYELEESSTGERSGRRTRGKVTLARGRGADMDRSERTTAAIAKKAGLRGTGKYSTKDLRTKAKDYTTYDSEDTEDDIGSTEQDHYIRTHSSARKAAKGEQLIKKFKPAGRTATGMTKLKTAPSSESVRRVKDLKKSMSKSGANKRGKVHTVDVMHRDSDVGKGDKSQQMERGRNFIQALKDTPKHLKAAGAKKGDTVTGKPTAVMSGEDKKTGEAKRAKLYKKVFGKRSTEKSAKTGLMTGKVD